MTLQRRHRQPTRQQEEEDIALCLLFDCWLDWLSVLLV